MVVQFNYILTFVGLLLVQYSGYLVYGTETSDDDTNEFRNNTNIQSSFCNITVPEAVHTTGSIWRKSEEPGTDDLDVFMINKTGCNYAALIYLQQYIQVTTFNGEMYKWRGGVRTREDVHLQVRAGPSDVYIFSIGEYHNNDTVTRVYRWNGVGSTEQSLSTPGLLSVERYVWFHVTVEPGRLTLETECDGALNVTRPMTVRRGDELRIRVVPWSPSGGKLLHGCPAHVL